MATVPCEGKQQEGEKDRFNLLVLKTAGMHVALLEQMVGRGVIGKKCIRWQGMIQMQKILKGARMYKLNGAVRNSQCKKGSLHVFLRLPIVVPDQSLVGRALNLGSFTCSAGFFCGRNR